MTKITKKEIILWFIKFMILAYFFLYCAGDGSLPSINVYIKFLGKTVTSVLHLVEKLFEILIAFTNSN
ncbi:MAG: hypothetical protein LUG91_05415 [Ruminococcus sp.]|nr:hypothetical protein [Ruminococcus sp.]